MPAIVIASTIVLLLGIVVTWWVHSRGKLEIVVDPQDTEKQSRLDPAPLISVIIPARNEERDIRECVQALLSQTYPNYEIIVVDDCSTDDTPRLLSELQLVNRLLRVIRGVGLPSGWAGKPHALVQGVAAARGEWLCFIDADTFASPELLDSCYRLAIRLRADMFSILTEQILGSFWERTILPLVFLGLSFGFPGERVNDPGKPDAISNGQFILIKKGVYEQVGGHSAVKDHIDDDKALAVIVKRAGHHLVLADGRKVARTRMYTSLPEMWEGWTKNIYLGLKDKLWLLTFGAVLGLLVSILLPVWLVGGTVWLATGGGGSALVVAGGAVVLWGYLLWKRLQAAHYFNIPGWYAFTFPLGALIFTLMMLISAFNVLSRRGVSWKGRTYH